MKKIYVVGSSNTDMVVKCKTLPTPGETVLGSDYVRVQGGKGANQAVASARLGGEVTFFCRVGDDPFGLESLEEYRKDGIDTSHVIVEKGGASGVALIMVDAKGENYIAVASGVNNHMRPEDVEPLQEMLQPGDVILMQLEIPIDTVVRTAQIGQQKGAIVILDPAPAPSQGLPKTLYSMLDFILPNRNEAAALVGTATVPEVMTQALLNTGVNNVIITVGNQGCIWARQEGQDSLPTYPVKSMDSTAAGDAFAGGLAVALAREKPVREAIEWGQKAATMSVTRMGAQPSLPTKEEMEQYEFPEL